MRELVDRPQGFLVTSGPTGAGKTSTLYSFLRLIDTRRTNVMTLEDPIEVELPQITQGQTNVKAGFTFATGLRAILRQDPDVIMVGEIRDAETAGHRAPGVAHRSPRALDAPHVGRRRERRAPRRSRRRAVDHRERAHRRPRAAPRAPRLQEPARRTSRSSIRSVDGDEVVLPAGHDGREAAKGCAQCLRTGYKGRTGIFEVVMVDDDMRELIKQGEPARVSHAPQEARDRRRFAASGCSEVKEGITTVEEVVRVTI